STHCCPLRGDIRKIGTIQRRLAWPLHKDDTLSRSGRPTGLNIYYSFFLKSRCNQSIFDCPCLLLSYSSRVGHGVAAHWQRVSDSGRLAPNFWGSSCRFFLPHMCFATNVFPATSFACALIHLASESTRWVSRKVQDVL
ncbi:hypothetical protein BDR06DRAFT_1055706, partial [Suillus hirtellus]